MLTLHDDANTGDAMEITTNIFGQPDHLPTGVVLGTIIRLHRAVVQSWNGHLQLLAKLSKTSKS